MRKTYTNHIIFISFAGIINILFLCFLYAVIDYQRENKRAQIYALEKFALTQNNLKYSLIKFDQYISLVESRLLHADSNKDRTLNILSFRPNFLAGEGFPEIAKLEFTHASTPAVSFSRFGEIPLSKKYVLSKIKNVWTYLGEGEFLYRQELKNYAHKPLGTLICLVSFKEALYKEFSPEELKISPLTKLEKDSLNVRINAIPFVLSLDYSRMSFIDYLRKIEFYLLSILSFIFFSLICGFGGGFILFKKVLSSRKKQIS